MNNFTPIIVAIVALIAVAISFFIIISGGKKPTKCTNLIAPPSLPDCDPRSYKNIRKLRADTLYILHRVRTEDPDFDDYAAAALAFSRILSRMEAKLPRATNGGGNYKGYKPAEGGINI